MLSELVSGRVASLGLDEFLSCLGVFGALEEHSRRFTKAQSGVVSLFGPETKPARLVGEEV